jgi:hypothetical protein
MLSTWDEFLYAEIKQITDQSLPTFRNESQQILAEHSSDWIATFKSVFRLISAMAVSNALWRKFAQIGSGASWMIFPSASFTDSSPRTFRSCSSEVRFVPTAAYIFAQMYRRRAYWPRSPISAGFSATYSGRRFFDSSQCARTEG